MNTRLDGGGGDASKRVGELRESSGAASELSDWLFEERRH